MKLMSYQVSGIVKEVSKKVVREDQLLGQPTTHLFWTLT